MTVFVPEAWTGRGTPGSKPRRGIGASVDFVIVGIVIGAVLVGAGALLRDLGPRLRPRIERADSREIELEALAHAWTRFCQSLGMAVTTLGFLIVVATVIGFFMNVSGGTGWAIVGVMTLLAIAGTVASVVKMGEHYRNGGFDPRVQDALASPPFEPAIYRTEPAALISADMTIPLEPIDPFAVPDPALNDEASTVAVEPTPELVDESTVSMPVASEVAASEDHVTTTTVAETELALDSAAGEEFVELEETRTEAEAEVIALEPEAVDLPEPRLSAILDPEPDYISGAAFEPPVESLQPPVRTWQPHEHIPSDRVPVLSEFEPPLIDPDDDLPAWGGPPAVERITPVPIQRTPQAGGTRVFESSLLADLAPESAPSDELSGPFQSRLLNELTADREKPEPDGNDVLIAEVPAVDPGRGARSE